MLWYIIKSSRVKVEKVDFFTHSSIKIFCSSIFNVGDCLESCLTLRLFLMLDPLQLAYKKAYS